MKLCYKFMVHDKEEFNKVYKLFENRKFGILDYSDEYEDFYWIEFPNNLINPLNFDFNKIDGTYIRVYFNNDHNREKFRKKIKQLLPIICGNDKCTNDFCKYHPHTCKNGKFEALWRCIWQDDEDCIPHRNR